MDPTAGLYCPNRECPDRTFGGTIPEFRPGTSVCPTCGESLEVGPPPVDDPDEELDVAARDAMASVHAGQDVVVFRSRILPEADMVAALLEENEIPHTRLLLTPGGMVVSIGLRATQAGSMHLVLVPAAAADRARTLMESTFGPEIPDDAIDEDDDLADGDSPEQLDGYEHDHQASGGLGWTWRLVAIVLLSAAAYMILRAMLAAAP